MEWIKFFLALTIHLLPVNTPAENEFCGLKNISTQPGEQIDFTVYYNVAGIYVNAGSAVFSNKLEKLNGRPVFHITGSGRSNAKYDWIFKVRDVYETYIDTMTMQPLLFSRDVHEGSTRKKELVHFDHEKQTATTDQKTIKFPVCTQDVLSAVYLARNLDFKKYKKGDKIPFTMFLENEVHNLYIRFMGYETVETRYGKFKAIKFKPLLMEGTIFSGGEKMTVWVTDDGNRIPVRIESQILIGSIKVDMMKYKGLRYPLGSQ